MRRAAHVDANQGSIVEALRAVGCKVLSLAAIGKGVPDLLVRRPFGLGLVLLEVKNGKRPPSRQRLRPGQRVFAAEWGEVVRTVKNVHEALEAVGVKVDIEALRQIGAL